MSAIERTLDEVAQHLHWLDVEPVFIGGATIGLFLDPFGKAQLRPTFDIDCIVPGVVSRGAWWRLEAQLRSRGWAPDPNGPICRYRSPHDTPVDLMAEDPTVLGFSGHWSVHAVGAAERRVVAKSRGPTTEPARRRSHFV